MKIAATKRGSILVFSLILFFMMLTISVSIAIITLNEKRTATVTDNSTQALQIGDSAAELFVVKAKSISYINELVDAPSPFLCINDKLVPTMTADPKGSYTITLYDKLFPANEISCTNATILANGIGKIKINSTYDGTVRATEVASMNVASIVTATCSDGVQNGDELNVDCGGSCPTVCDCTSYDYTAWSACVGGIQTRSTTNLMINTLLVGPGGCNTVGAVTVQAC